MQGNVITLLADRVQAGGMLYITRQSPCRIDRNVRIIAVNLHTQSNGCIGNLSTNGTQTYHTKLLALDLAAGEGLLCLLGRFGNVCVLFILFAPLDTAHDIAGCQEQSGKHQLLNAIRIGTRSVKNNNAFLYTSIERNVIDTGSCACNSQQGVGKLHFMKGCAADQNTLCLIYLICELIVFCELVCAIFRNGVDAMDLSHA